MDQDEWDQTLLFEPLPQPAAATRLSSSLPAATRQEVVELLRELGRLAIRRGRRARGRPSGEDSGGSHES